MKRSGKILNFEATVQALISVQKCIFKVSFSIEWPESYMSTSTLCVCKVTGAGVTRCYIH